MLITLTLKLVFPWCHWRGLFLREKLVRTTFGVDRIWVLKYGRHLTPIRIPFFVTSQRIRTARTLRTSSMSTAMPISLRIQEPEGIDYAYLESQIFLWWRCKHIEQNIIKNSAWDTLITARFNPGWIPFKLCSFLSAWLVSLWRIIFTCPVPSWEKEVKEFKVRYTGLVGTCKCELYAVL